MHVIPDHIRSSSLCVSLFEFCTFFVPISKNRIALPNTYLDFITCLHSLLILSFVFTDSPSLLVHLLIHSVYWLISWLSLGLYPAIWALYPILYIMPTVDFVKRYALACSLSQHWKIRTFQSWPFRWHGENELPLHAIVECINKQK